MISLIEILKSINEISTYSDDLDTWVHVTNSDQAIEKWKKEGKILGQNEDLSEFTYDVPKGISVNKQNPNSPNFYKGQIYPGAPKDIKYVITFTPKETYPGDESAYSNWKDIKYAVIPNGNRVNRESFKKSSKIGLIKPQFRDIKNFKFFKYNPETKKHEEFKLL